ncbi:MAG: tetratricopeptide (TPR) repeat protein [Glaciecola sp.]|jgi:tetratricopeptide (TPR) repeat protein
MHKALLLLPLYLLGCSALQQAEPTPIIYRIGEIHRTVHTSVPEAQLWFDRGLALSFGFNHEAAVVCFEKAAELDPECAMAYWGKAYALGPNYNNFALSEEACAGAYEALVQAERLSSPIRPLEQALIQALFTRQPSPNVEEDRAPLEKAYANAMRRIYKEYSDDPDVVALTGESLMNLRPWKLWSPEGVAAPEVFEIRQVLEAGLERWPDHPALCHLYIHTMEAGPEVAAATEAADRLVGLAPGLGHLVHMPTHIYIWTGRYKDAVRINQQAVAADTAYVEHAGRMNFYTGYRLHNYHFIAYAGMWSGQREVALQAARTIPGEVPADLLAAHPDFVEIFLATHLHVMVRFGMWEEILQEPQPPATQLGPTAVWQYSRALAFASLGRVEEALKSQQDFLAAKAAVPETRTLFQNPVIEILTVAEAFLQGEILYRQGEFDAAFVSLREATALDKKLNYDEPWGWMEPASHALGALLLEQGHHAEALEVYQANLARFPENGWALNGLAECLDALGQPEAALDARQRFETAFSLADVEIPGSCFCRTAKQ